MKKTRFLLLLATVAFAATSFTACTSEDEIAEPATSIDGELGEPIKAQFTISIPMNSKSTTRMSATTVQNDQDVASFRGIDFISLFPSTAATIGATSGIESAISLTQILRPNQITVNNYIPSKNLVSNNNSVLYGDVMLPSGIKSFLFYGKAIDNTAGNAITTADDKFKFGTLKAEITTTGTDLTPGGFTFSPVPIVPATNVNSLGKAKRDAILAYLNSIAQAADKTDAENPVYWYKQTETGGNSVLGNLYTKFTSMKAGSSESIVDALYELYVGLKDNAHGVAKAVCKAITNSTYVTDPNGAFTLTDAVSNYPSEINLPDGAAVLTYNNTTHEFSYAGLTTDYSSDPATPVVTPMNVANVSDFVYPANLFYWVKSAIKVSNTSQADNYKSDNTWSTILSSYTDGNVITSNTRSVALESPVQYGVGRLDIKVRTDKDNLADNGAGTDDGETSVGYGDIKLTGILIGQQKPVDWEFKTMTTGPEYTIYDNIVKSQGITTNGIGISNSTPTAYQNHTLVLETEGGEEECVNIALEFVNNGGNFWGANGRIRNKDKFYLLGKLDIKNNAKEGTASKTGNKVFKQDFRTMATFTISSLKQAYNTIPDLRNPRIELGLSVDLEWQEGVTFEQTIN